MMVRVDESWRCCSHLARNSRVLFVSLMQSNVLLESMEGQTLAVIRPLGIMHSHWLSCTLKCYLTWRWKLFLSISGNSIQQHMMSSQLHGPCFWMTLILLKFWAVDKCIQLHWFSLQMLVKLNCSLSCVCLFHFDNIQTLSQFHFGCKFFGLWRKPLSFTIPMKAI